VHKRGEGEEKGERKEPMPDKRGQTPLARSAPRGKKKRGDYYYQDDNLEDSSTIEEEGGEGEGEG